MPHSARLRVLALTQLFPSDPRPTFGIFNARLLAHLSALAEVRVVAPIRWLPGVRWTRARERALAAVPRRVRCGPLDVEHPRYPRVPLWARRWHGTVNALALARPVARTVREFRPHILLASWAYPDGFAARRLGARSGVPVVIDCVGSDVNEYLDDPRRRPPLLEGLSCCARVATVSHALKSRLVDHGIPAWSIDVHRMGVDRSVFRPRDRAEARRALGLPAEDRILLSVAGLDPIKGHDTLLQAFRSWLERDPRGATLALVGDGPSRARLAAEVNGLGLAGHVRFAGARPHHEIASWMAASDAVCLASLDEGLPNVLMEALACGRPVVATRVGGVPELVTSERYGLLVERQDVAGLARRLGEVLGRSWDPAALAACPEIVSWERSAEDLLGILSRAAAPGPRATGSARGARGHRAVRQLECRA